MRPNHAIADSPRIPNGVRTKRIARGSLKAQPNDKPENERDKEWPVPSGKKLGPETLNRRHDNATPTFQMLDHHLPSMRDSQIRNKEGNHPICYPTPSRRWWWRTGDDPVGCERHDENDDDEYVEPIFLEPFGKPRLCHLPKA